MWLLRDEKRRIRRAKLFSYFPFLYSLFPNSNRRGSYDLEKRRRQENVIIPSGSNCKKTFPPPKDDTEEKFLMALYDEGLLKTNFIIKDGSKKRKRETMVVFVKFDHPVIEIGLGFTNRELAMTDRFEKYRCFMPNNELEIDGTCRVSIEIKQELPRRHRGKSQSRIVSTMIDIYDPEVENHLLKKFRRRRRRRRSIFTRKGQHGLVRPPPTKPVLIGDNLAAENRLNPRFMMPHQTPEELRVMMHVMTYRMGELGEQQRFYRYRQGPVPADYVLPNNLNDVSQRETDRHFPRRPTVPRSVHRSGSDPDQPLDNRRVIPAVYEFEVSDMFHV